MDNKKRLLDPVDADIAQRLTKKPRSEGARLFLLNAHKGRLNKWDMSIALMAVNIAETDAYARAKKAFFNVLNVAGYSNRRTKAMWSEFVVEFLLRGDGDMVYDE
jgi:hypothetical protein